MAISVNPLTFVITVPQADLTFISGTLYELDTNSLRLQLKAWEANLTGGATELKTNIHATEVTAAGTTFARTITIIPPYSLEFEDGQYTVLLKGSNNNYFDVADGILVQNQVQVIPGNSAGLIRAAAEWTQVEKDDVTAKVTDLFKILTNKNQLNKSTGVLTIFDDDNTTPLFQIATYSDDANATAYDGTAAIHSQDKAT